MGAFDMGPFWKCRRGFTTIEVIAVLILLGVIAALVVARLSGTSGYTVQSTAEMLKNHLRHAQARAMSSNVIWGVFFISNTQYTIYRNGNTGSTNWVNPPGADSNTVNLTTQGVTLGVTANDVVSFDDWGRPYTDAAGNTLQSGTRSITVTGGGQTATIQINPNTGYIP
jgi:prepilin-type N-terminal cleavage/methylation domain-containing protein